MDRQEEVDLVNKELVEMGIKITLEEDHWDEYMNITVNNKVIRIKYDYLYSTTISTEGETK